ncbi:MGMT family protein [Chitinimonas sp.]|uniref:MGMT family protein n=1 Tax=Chitinimonas sp. TaxID=1934313 RepID=UPI0035B19C6C
MSAISRSASALDQAFLRVIQQIPPGRVMSYGAVARAAGLPRHARHVGVALKRLPDEQAVPWWRVVNGEGRISPRGLDGSDDLQRVLLEAEAVEFDGAGRIDLRRFAWLPD